ncbi:hypothetical protein PAT3040_05858 [Paenibacillus agaridevorans]|uniref:Uncharacterized protein n=1 Tax=Paenibacillus agaridevorans TaxID=171404 RepID=A0A2R5EWJ9_9BACL|nr:hypothetical protein PAT3040_05858 [Paenibacillus agaridevorans]
MAIADLEEPAKLPLTLEQLAYTMALMANLSVTPESALDEVVSKGWLAETTLSDIEDSQELKVGEVFSLVRDLMEFYVGKVYS